MVKNQSLPIDSISGFSAITFYCFFTFIAILYSEAWNPLNNTLSQLGNSNLQPHSAIFYTFTMILAGFSLLVFYMCIYKRHIKKIQDKRLLLILFIGCINGVSIIFSGVFSENLNYGLHIIFSILLFITFIPLLFFIGRFLTTNTTYPTIVSYYGYVVAVLILLLLCSLVFSGFGGSVVPLLEFISVFSFIGWIGLISYSSPRFNSLTFFFLIFYLSDYCVTSHTV